MDNPTKNKLMSGPLPGVIEPLLKARDMAAIFRLKDPESAYRLPIRRLKRGRSVSWHPQDVRLYISLNMQG